MNVLIVALDDTRWGPARLPKFLAGAGFRVAALCPQSNPLAATKHLDQRFDLPRAASAWRLATPLRRAMEIWRPRLVIPADEIVLAFLHSLLGDRSQVTAARWSEDLRATLAASLCPPAQREAMLFKNECQMLARRIGVRTPEGEAVGCVEQALDVAGGLGFPVALKQSFGWGGVGVRLCESPQELDAAYAAMALRRPNLLLQAAKRLTARDWFPAPRALWVQKAVAGDPAFYSTTCVDGKMLAGFAGFPRSTSSQTGPSTVVDFGPHAAMAEASRTMIAALGASGFVSFDFMIERATGDAYLLECNARPNQVSHLGARFGVDMCAALHDALRGAPAPARPLEPKLSETVTLFPQEWLRAPGSAALSRYHHDAPWDDETLIAYCAMRSGQPLRMPSAAALPAGATARATAEG